MSLSRKILILSGGAAAVTALVLLAVGWWFRGGVESDVQHELDRLGRKQCSTAAEGIISMLRLQQATLEASVDSGLNVAGEFAQRSGGIGISDQEQVSWTAVNQFTGESRECVLPQVRLGETSFNVNAAADQPTLFVDEVASLLGDATCTVFQRVNSAGDMLRVATNVKNAKGKRGIGTYIPATDPDGTENPVVASLLRGERFVGRAFVVDDWYWAGYEPVFDEHQALIGAVYVGFKLERVKQVRDAIKQVRVGKDGYACVFGSTGNHRGHYIISYEGLRDGEDASMVEDADGERIIDTVIQTAVELKAGECEFVSYPWQNPGEAAPRQKIAAVKYYEPWDWTVMVTAYEDDFQEARDRTSSAFNWMMLWSAGGAAAVLAVVLVAAVYFARQITLPLADVASGMQEISEGNGDLTKRLPTDSGDEAAELADAFNTLMDKLQAIIGDVIHTAGELGESSREILATATELSKGAQETTGRSSSVAGAAEEMSASMGNMSAASEQMTANVKAVAAAVEEMTATISEIAKNAEQASSVADNASKLVAASNENVGTLGEAACEVGHVIQVIQDIAEQTNLLALNATIEAARAGEAGKGFAVVATEVKELARQTAEATEDIRRRVEAIQSSSKSAVDSIGEISTVIEEVNQVSRTIASAVEEQSITTREIARNVNQTSQAASTVSENVAQSAGASQEISSNLTGVDEAARQTADGAVRTKDAGEKMAGLSAKLEGLVGGFAI